MIEARYCQACGIKVRGKREKCPRCGGELTALPAELRLPTAGERKAAAAGIVVILVGIALIVLWPRPAPPPEVAVPVPGRAPAVRGPQGRSPSAVPQGLFEPPFLTPKSAGTVAYDRGDLDRALNEYQKAVAENPDDAESLSNLGQVLVRQDKAQEAVPFFERAIKLLPRRWAYHFNLARAMGETGDWERAVAEYRVAQGLYPDDYVTEYNLARALHKAGREEEAVQGYLRAIQLEPTDASFRLALGISYERLKRTADAARAYQEYVTLAPDAPDVAKVKERIDLLLKGPSPPEATPPATAPPVR